MGFRTCAAAAREGGRRVTLPFSVRLRAHAAGLEEVVSRIAGGGRDEADLLALAGGPLPLLAAMASKVAPKDAAIVGTLPVELQADAASSVERALIHRAAAEAEVVEIQAGPGSDATVAIAAEAVQALLSRLRGATASIDEGSLAALAAASDLPLEEAASRLRDAGVSRLTAFHPASSVGGLAVRQTMVVPAAIDLAFVQSLRAGAAGPLHVVGAEGATGVQLLRGVALARLAGYGPITVGGGDELKGPDACLAFGADRIEAQLDPPGTMGSRTRAYGESAVHGAQLGLIPPARRAAPGGRVAHILDDVVDPSLLPGGDPAAVEPKPLSSLPLHPEVRS